MNKKPLSDFNLDAMKKAVNSPKSALEIKLSNQQFDSFLKACEDAHLKPSNEILAAAKLLDTEGF